MAGHVHQRTRAKRDLVEHYVYLAENAGIETAERFLQGAEQSLDDLSVYPDMGERFPGFPGRGRDDHR